MRMILPAAMLLAAAPALAAPADDAGALAAAKAMLAAMSAGDAAAFTALTVPEGLATGTGVRDGKPYVSTRSWAAFAANVKPGSGVVETMSRAEVRSDGDIAMVWGDFTLTRNGAFVHCGINHFDLVRQDGKWRVLNVTWTQRTDGCAGR
ncbi:DUF4440 domain-containing protein [Sphingomonas quercus]|uniref:Nuclear transport factor 2 family protein n=1 Tax=Sphingomonas quercus TaxID=2842451 RepID=A0ABS6BEC6_9SPHN|nr:DUF4440 domain-containing protein [Sphingomonas quercus]MBU3076663.1 nuclear transport factor 2 family protein [Sphingomonas quercus]